MSSTIVGMLRRTARRSGRAGIGILLTGGLLLAHPAPALAASADGLRHRPAGPEGHDRQRFFLYAEDPDGDPLTYEVLTQPLHGDLTDCSDTSGYCNYAPAPGFVGTDSFTFRVSDGTTNSNTATIRLQVTDPAAPQAYDSGRNAAPGTPTDISLSGYDPDEGDLTFHILTAPAHGTLGTVGPVVCDYVDAFYLRRDDQLHRRRRHRWPHGHVHLRRRRSRPAPTAAPRP